MTTAPAPHFPVVVVGGGQAGLAMSRELSVRGIAHVVFEKHRVGHAWRTQRWDSFCLVTPNWQCLLPGFAYAGADPHGFMPRDEIVAYVESYARHIEAPVREGVAVTRIAPAPGGFALETSEGAVTADAVVLAVGGYHRPNIPRSAERLPTGILQVHSSAYRNAESLPEGAVVVVGSGQSGCQIAEDLHLAGRAVHLVTGSAPRCPRVYRGRDAVDWLADLGQYELPVERHPLGAGVRRKANHYLTGRGGGRDIDLRRFAAEGMRLYGRLDGVDPGGAMRFRADLAANLDGADAVYNGICELIDRHIAEAGIDAPPGGRYAPVWQPAADQPQDLDVAASGVSAVVWATGFISDWSFVDLPLFDGSGYPRHQRGVTAVPGVYVLGLPWLHTWGSGRFVGVGRDADYLGDAVAAHLAAQLGTDEPVRRSA
ncbi:MSMEG_0569 family flavin-dependent oxidoreductase [Methylobrevis albus]|uniref:MSMEG_0569 family flavin-dependent oxidoreductase n=1 Tax=Methylobrevis albus TaxID=2793297 RepID=A0A931I1R8_9HYPH|nr:MSMEG_0569 family flavin-dependent oxidoreductase [Methylobrevis albus]MBH0237366.1 MSMEG_0569 family flavin-dependent oxidoreductase [Methylobrevis albus]